MAKKFSNAARAGEQGDERRAQIIDAAAEAFMTEGFAATSIDDIARLLGCTKGLIYYHFKNKTELFFAVHWQTMETNLGVVRPIAASGVSAADRLARMIRAHMDGVFERLPFQRVFASTLEQRAEAKSHVPQGDLRDLINQLRYDPPSCRRASITMSG